MKPTRAIVDLSAIRHNLKEAGRLNPGKTLCAVVKADGYGHGAAPVARAAIQAGAGCLAVAQSEEAVPLREAGFDLPILVLGPSMDDQIDLGLTLGLELTVVSADSLREVKSRARAIGVTPRVHVKLDTGMGRVGVRGVNELSALLDELDGVILAGAFTHFCVADTADKSFTYCQYDRFKAMCGLIRARGFNPVVHCQNSAAIIDLPEIKADLARVGIMLYGLRPSDEVDLKRVDLRPAMSWETRISQVKTISPGESVSYGRVFTASRETKVATLHVGYGDGYKRSMTGRAMVIAAGEKRPVIGRICMDQTMVDVTGLDVKAGDRAVLMGRVGDAEITADDLSLWSGALNYEVVTTIMPRVTRVYTDD